MLLGIAVFVYITYAVLDTAVSGPMAPNLLVLRYGIVMPLLVGIAAGFAKGWFRGRERIAFALCFVIAVASISYVHVLHYQPLSRTLPTGATAVVFLACLIYLPTFRQTLTMSLAIFAACGLFAVVVDTSSLSTFVNFYFVGLYCALLIVGMFFLEATERAQEVFRHDLKNVFDILRRSESRAIALYRDAKKAESARDEFLAVVSHELRTPMNAIIGFSDVLSRQAMGRIQPPVYHEYATYIQDSGRQLLGLIDDILDISRAELDRITFETVPFDIAATLDAALAACAAEADRSGVTVTRGPPPGAMAFTGDEARIAQAIGNVLGNAIKFSNPGGGGTVAVSLDRDEDDGTVRITVSDDGIGIAPENIEAIVLPFRQAQSAFVRDNGGLGLGLAICAFVVQAHDGKLRIESVLGKGTTVTLVLSPARADAGAAGTPALLS